MSVKTTAWAVLALATVLSGCSKYASNGEALYLSARNGPNLVVPSPLSSVSISHYHDLPDVPNPAPVNLAPPGSNERDVE